MKPAFIVLCALAVGLLVPGCTTQPPPPSLRPTPDKIVKQFHDRVEAQSAAQLAEINRQTERYRPQLRKYLACNTASAKGIAFQQGDPVSLALAARGLCGKVEAELQKAIVDAFSDPGLGNHTMETARQTALEHNAAEIVAARAARDEGG